MMIVQSLTMHLRVEFNFHGYIPDRRNFSNIDVRQTTVPLNFVFDLEKAISARSAETGAMLHKITDLFLLHAGHYSADQVALYDNVLKVLVGKVDVAARSALAARLAPIDDAPGKTIRSLALDDAIEVAEPF